jgi:hypothetical protein
LESPVLLPKPSNLLSALERPPRDHRSIFFRRVLLPHLFHSHLSGTQAIDRLHRQWLALRFAELKINTDHAPVLLCRNWQWVNSTDATALQTDVTRRGTHHTSLFREPIMGVKQRVHCSIIHQEMMNAYTSRQILGSEILSALNRKTS